jgi:hypothetical protein
MKNLWLDIHIDLRTEAIEQLQPLLEARIPVLAYRNFRDSRMRGYCKEDCAPSFATQARDGVPAFL